MADGGSGRPTDETTDAPDGGPHMGRDGAADDIGRQPGWRGVLTVAAAAVAVVVAAAALTAVLPQDAQRVVFHTPLLIVVLLVGTGFVLWRITFAGRPPR